MEVGKTLHVATRKAWRTWLKKNHASKKEIWLVYPLKHTGKRRIPCNDAVEEALCFGGTLERFHEAQASRWAGKDTALAEIRKNIYALLSRIRYTDKFDDPNLPGEIETTSNLKKVSCAMS